MDVFGLSVPGKMKASHVAGWDACDRATQKQLLSIDRRANCMRPTQSPRLVCRRRGEKANKMCDS